MSASSRSTGRPVATETPGAGVLRVTELSVSFPATSGTSTRILDRVSLELAVGETAALVGESGSGKSLTALTMMGLLDNGASIDGGSIMLDGNDLLAMNERAKKEYRGKRIGMIFQTPTASLNPVLKAGEQITRVVRRHSNVGRRGARGRAVELMRAVGINDAVRRYHAYPHQLSGGMAQRIMIAIALAAEPELLIADEPTTGLDVTIQAQIFELLASLQERFHMGILLITHDLAVVAETCDRVIVMHAGHVVETAPVLELFEHPQHPYTQRLLAATRSDRRPGGDASLDFVASSVFVDKGCRYRSRCPLAFKRCASERPAAHSVGPGHFALCHLHDPSGRPVAAECP